MDFSGTHINGDGQRSTVASQASVLQLYAAVLDDIREKAQAIVEWAEGSIQEFEAATAQPEGGPDATE